MIDRAPYEIGGPSMSWLYRCLVALVFGLAWAALSTVQAADPVKEKEDPKFKKEPVSFRTVDGVDLKGTLWTNAKDKKNACVLLLHNFSRKSGGNRSDDGWGSLAEELAKAGYTVLSFDFRGHGDSTSVAPEFWNQRKFPHNYLLLRPPIPKEAPTKLDYKDFPFTPNYYPHLVDDIAAAKAFLENKAGDGAGNLVVIGAGQGATLGAMWMATEYRRFREKGSNVMGQPLPNPESEPEGKDIACGIWLTVSPSIDSTPVQTQLNNWLDEVGGKRNRVPMLFLYGKDDPTGRAKLNASMALTKMLPPGYRMMEDSPGQNKDSNYKFTRDYAVATKLEGSQMLQNSLNTSSVIKAYIRDVLEERGNREAKRHEAEKYRYFWIPPGGGINQVHPAKLNGEEFMMPIPLKMMGLQ
jgi:hypothetical protein